MDATAERSSYVRLELGQLDQLTVSVSVAPHITTLSLLTDAIRGRSNGMSGKLLGTVRSIQRSVPGDPIRPMVAPGCSVTPDVVVPIPPHQDVPARTHLEHLQSAPAEAVVQDLVNVFGDDLPRHWQPVADRPRQWLLSYAQAASDAWGLVQPLWDRADSLIQQEIERVAVATVRRQHDVLLNDLSRKVVFRDGSLFFPDSEPATYELNGRPLVLVPMLSSIDAIVANFDRDDMVWVAYPIPGLGQLSERDKDTDVPNDAVETLLGPHRAAILRFLDDPLNMSGLSRRVRHQPSTLTHHCDRLVQAGLITRQRRGREIRVRRTERGTALLDLLEN